ncbi:MAG: hypothetical protein FJW20_15460 [Acidimicrobiia bacterium]|nr:hypothetical protein [Acidimicrobiia bacterium]
MSSVLDLLLAGLSHSIGWGVRGNWGHEHGAMIPGALSAMAIAARYGRADWQHRIAWFAFFGAMGWSFGGSMSYGLIIGKTKADTAPEIAYGFAMLFVIGFLWGAMGGAGAAMAAVLDSSRLRQFFPPLICVFLAWTIRDLADYDAPNWFDTDWAGVTLLLAAVAAYCAWRRRIDDACSLILTMGVGWWAGFLLLTAALGLRMTPPRSDNWAGCIGMTAAMFVWFHRRRLGQINRAALLTALFSGAGFSLGDVWQVLGPRTGIETNWWSLMEQSFGLLAGIGLYLAFRRYLGNCPPLEPETPHWSHAFSVWFLLVVVTYINISRNVSTAWLKSGALPESWYGLSAGAWFHLGYALLALTVTVLILRPGALVPENPLGKSQALYIVFLWWILLGDLSRYLPFPPGRMISEGIFFFNACLCTMLIARQESRHHRPAVHRFFV